MHFGSLCEWHANTGEKAATSLSAWQRTSGLTAVGALWEGLESGRWRRKKYGDHALFRQLNGVLFVNGLRVEGGLSRDRIKRIIDSQVAIAHSRIKQGVLAKDLYMTLTKVQFEALVPEQDIEADIEADTKTVYRVPVGKSPILGPNAAPVTIVTFGDFRDPFTRKLQPVLDELLKVYPDKVRLVWKNEPLPFHKDAIPSAVFALQARKFKGESGFWDARNFLFRLDPAVDFKIGAAAKSLGISAVDVVKAIETSRFGSDFAADHQLATDLHVRGTPVSFINGRRLVGAQEVKTFKPMVDEELAKAQQLVANGTPPAEVYDVLTKDGLKVVEQTRRPIPTSL
jgi:protein-disulfide isomerase